ncbi:hypothetical protein GGX14DRAFT_398189 [Mycena pura]|uniref:Uncharacterized protein n=1 Tax=Mycena pura TaxID=153505 RepID=A0AAD6Y9S5_9AGAR|nr:hypothetical protein GGX14DRAFT_398189 [Mycena pura]
MRAGSMFQPVRAGSKESRERFCSRTLYGVRTGYRTRTQGRSIPRVRVRAVLIATVRGDRNASLDEKRVGSDKTAETMQPKERMVRRGAGRGAAAPSLEGKRSAGAAARVAVAGAPARGCGRAAGGGGTQTRCALPGGRGGRARARCGRVRARCGRVRARCGAAGGRMRRDAARRVAAARVAVARVAVAGARVGACAQWGSGRVGARGVGGRRAAAGRGHDARGRDARGRDAGGCERNAARRPGGCGRDAARRVAAARGWDDARCGRAAEQRAAALAGGGGRGHAGTRARGVSAAGAARARMRGHARGRGCALGRRAAALAWAGAWGARSRRGARAHAGACAQSRLRLWAQFRAAWAGVGAGTACVRRHALVRARARAQQWGVAGGAGARGGMRAVAVAVARAVARGVGRRGRGHGMCAAAACVSARTGADTAVGGGRCASTGPRAVAAGTDAAVPGAKSAGAGADVAGGAAQQQRLALLQRERVRRRQGIARGVAGRGAVAAMRGGVAEQARVRAVTAGSPEMGRRGCGMHAGARRGTRGGCSGASTARIEVQRKGRAPGRGKSWPPQERARRTIRSVRGECNGCRTWRLRRAWGTVLGYEAKRKRKKSGAGAQDAQRRVHVVVEEEQMNGREFALEGSEEWGEVFQTVLRQNQELLTESMLHHDMRVRFGTDLHNFAVKYSGLSLASASSGNADTALGLITPT